MRAADHAGQQSEIGDVLALVGDGRPGSSSWSLAAAIRLPVKVRPPMTTSKPSGVIVRLARISCRGVRCIRRCRPGSPPAPERVRQGRPLRHGGHGDAQAHRAAHDRADEQAAADPEVAPGIDAGGRACRRWRPPCRTRPGTCRAGPLGRAEPFQPEDEQHGGEDVEIAQHFVRMRLTSQYVPPPEARPVPATRITTPATTRHRRSDRTAPALSRARS